MHRFAGEVVQTGISCGGICQSDGRVHQQYLCCIEVPPDRPVEFDVNAERDAVRTDAVLREMPERLLPSFCLTASLLGATWWSARQKTI